MKTLQPVSRELVITFPWDAVSTEFEVHAYLYFKLCAAGVDVRGEVNWKHPTTREHCRFDLVIYRDGVPVHIVEMKARPVKHKTLVDDTRQGERYRQFGVPVSFVYGRQDADEFLKLAVAGEF